LKVRILRRSPSIVCPTPNAVKAVRGPPSGPLLTDKAPKRDGDHGSPCPVLAICTSWRGVIVMKIAVILALAFTLTAGMALTAAFGSGFIPLGF
jgi:hypothetical protein